MFVVMAVIAFFSANVVQASGTSNSLLDLMDATSVRPLQKQRNSQDKLPVQKLPKLLSKRESILQGADNPYNPIDIEITNDNDGSGNKTALVHNEKGLLEAIYDPASPTWNSTTDWKTAFNNNGGLVSYLGLGNRAPKAINPVSDIKTIKIDHDINMATIDDLLAKNYQINRYNPGKEAGLGDSDYNSYKFVQMRHDNLTIDAQNHILNMGFNNFALQGKTNSNNPYKEDWLIKNAEIYGSTFWGFISCNSGKAINHDIAQLTVKDHDPTSNDPNKLLTQDQIDSAKSGYNGGYSWITYKDDTYTGSQFSWTGSGTSGVTIAGTVVARSLYSYTVPNESSQFVWTTQSDGDQQNFQVNRVVFAKNSRFVGATYSGDCLDLNGTAGNAGKATLESGAKVDLYPHGSPDLKTPEDNDMYIGWGFIFKGPGTSLDLYGDSQLNLHCDNHDGNDLISLSDDGHSVIWQPGVTNEQEKTTGAGLHSKSSYIAGGLDMTSSTSAIAYHETRADDDSKKILSPEINIEGKGPVYGNHPLVNFAGGNAQLSHGKFSIKATNLNNQEDVNNNNKIIHYTNNSSQNTGGLMAVTGSNTRIEVKTGGDFSISASNDKDDYVTDSPVNLLYLGNGALVNLMNPKNVSLDLRNNNSLASALVYSYSNSKINAYDTRIQAYGDNDAQQSGIGVGTNWDSQITNDRANDFMDAYNKNYNTNYKYHNRQVISLGMQGNDSLSGSINDAVYKKEPIRMQTLTLPFYKYGIAFTNYLTQPADNVIQGHQTDLDLLKAAMVQMNGREFRYVRLSDLPGPTEDAVDKVGVPGASQISQKDITGKVGGDYWANDDESDNTLFNPVPPLLRVQLKQKDSDSLIDLGTMPNSKAAQEKTNDDLSDPGVTEVTPNPIDSNRNVRTDDKGNYMIGTKITTGGDTSNPQPKYLDSSIVTWDKNGWSKDTSSSENDPQHSFSYNLQEVLKNYNENHTDKKISFQPGDQVLTSVVTNYQETPVQNTRITNLYLQKGDEPKTPFLVGDKVTMPFQYIDTNPGASNLFLSGTIYKLVNDDGIITRKEWCTFNKQQVDDIKQSNDWETKTLDLPAKATSEPGKYVVEFNGIDNLYNAGPDDPVSWNYTVSNLPKYNGKKVLNDHTTGDTTKPGNIVSNLHYTVKTIFEAVNTTNGTLSEVKFNHPDNSDINIEENSDYTLTASYIDDKGQTINKPLNSGFEYGKEYYIPDDFGIHQGTFPKGVKFTITHKILVNAEKKDGVQIGADQMYSTENGKDILLGTSNSIKYNSVGSIVLNVGNKPIDYGTNPVAVPLKKERVFFIPKTQDPKVSVTNNTPYSQPIILTAQVDGDTSGLNNWLYYRKTEGNADDSDTLMTNKVTVFHDSVGTNVPQNISSSWFNPKTGEQVTGPILKLGQNSSPTPGKYSTKITWNLTNSL